ncbi:MAG TPA: hypothetical protein VLJ15_05625 [Gammaproteobacteria bacterium]|nr:hypothetical protein [Gammaproteobacteria bacterium]
MLNKRMITKRHTVTICEAVCLLLAIGVTCYVLCENEMSPVSIDSAWNYFSHWARHFHVIAVALLPVYVALVIFGTATLCAWLGSIVRRLIHQVFR